MSGDQAQPLRATTAATIRRALRDVSRDVSIRVATTDGAEQRGRFSSFDGETLILALTPAGDRTARIAIAMIRGIVRVHHCALEGAAVAGLLAVVAVSHVARMFLDASDPRLGGMLLLVGVPGLFVVGLAAGVGAVIGLAFDRNESLFETRPPR